MTLIIPKFGGPLRDFDLLSESSVKDSIDLLLDLSNQDFIYFLLAILSNRFLMFLLSASVM